MKIEIEISEDDVRRLVHAHLQSQLGELVISEKDVLVEVKSKQNFKSEWENAAFRVRLLKHT